MGRCGEWGAASRRALEGVLREGWRGAGVGCLVEAMVKGGGEMAEEVWRAARAHRLDLATPVLVGLLEGSPEVLVEEVEAFLLGGLREEEGEVVVGEVLASTLAASAPLHSAALAVWRTHLLHSRLHPRVVALYQRFTSAVRRHAPAPATLHAPALQGLAHLLLSWPALAALGRGEELAAAVLATADLEDLETKLLLLQFPEILPLLEFQHS